MTVYGKTEQKEDQTVGEFLIPQKNDVESRRNET